MANTNNNNINILKTKFDSFKEYVNKNDTLKNNKTIQNLLKKIYNVVVFLETKNLIDSSIIKTLINTIEFFLDEDGEHSVSEKIVGATVIVGELNELDEQIQEFNEETDDLKTIEDTIDNTSENIQKSLDGHNNNSGKMDKSILILIIVLSVVIFFVIVGLIIYFNRGKKTSKKQKLGKK